MKPPASSPRPPDPIKACCLALGPLLALLSGMALLASLPTSMCAAASRDGSIAGTVSNAGTGNLLEGAIIELPALGLVVLTDRTGRFMLSEVSPAPMQMAGVSDYVNALPSALRCSRAPAHNESKASPSPTARPQ